MGGWSFVYIGDDYYNFFLYIVNCIRSALYVRINNR